MANALFFGDLVTSQRILYTPSDFARTSLIHLQEIGKLQAQKPHISKRENLTSFLFFIVLSGSGILEYNGNIHNLSSGDCVFIDCRKPYYHESSSNLWTLKWIHFFGPIVSNVYQKYIERGGLPIIHPNSYEHFEVTWDNLYKIADSNDYIRDMKINECLNHLLTQIMAESWHPDSKHRSGTKKQNVLEIKNYLDENFNKKLTLDELADHFFINKYYLTRIFKEQFGMSITSYLTQIRITHAKQLLRFTEKNAEEIGLECGMGALYYFSRIFKKIEGISPTEYRKQWVK